MYHIELGKCKRLTPSTSKLVTAPALHITAPAQHPQLCRFVYPALLRKQFKILVDFGQFWSLGPPWRPLQTPHPSFWKLTIISYKTFLNETAQRLLANKGKKFTSSPFVMLVAKINNPDKGHKYQVWYYLVTQTRVSCFFHNILKAAENSWRWF